MALPAGWLATKLGYKGGFIAGLLMVAGGGFWFIPATPISGFLAFLLGVCVVPAGLTFLVSSERDRSSRQAVVKRADFLRWKFFVNAQT
jgi:fucose permease